MKPIVKTIATSIVSAALLIGMTTGVSSAHCEIPCGIYDDKLRTQLIAEHITTVERAMNRIVALAEKDPLNHNQMVRWVTNKENHAGEIQHIVSQYFMTQRIKPDQAHYAERLEVLHRMLLAAMKAKQTVDLQHAVELRKLLAKFERLYFSRTAKQPWKPYKKHPEKPYKQLF